MRVGTYLDWPALPAEERCCATFDKGKSLTDGLAGRMDLDTDACCGRIGLITNCEPKD